MCGLQLLGGLCVPVGVVFEHLACIILGLKILHTMEHSSHTMRELFFKTLAQELLFDMLQVGVSSLFRLKGNLKE